MRDDGLYRSDGVQSTRFASGLRLLSERIPGLRSLSLGIWILRGSRHEPAARSGAYHFLEHMLFKGTESRDTRAIARVVDSIGGQVNAFTGKENTCFYARILDGHVEAAVELLADLLRHSAFRKEDLERERRVILEEIKMVDDTPDDLVQNLFLERLWRENALARPILGTRKTVRAMSSAALARFFHANVRADTLLVTASGSVDHRRLSDLVQHHLGEIKGTAAAAPVTAPRAAPVVTVRSKPGLKQAYVCLGAPSYPRNHERRYALSVLNTILGTGMSSRLFQTVREERSLAYDVFSETVSYADAGYLLVYAGTGSSSVRELIAVVVEEIGKLTQVDVPEDELGRAKEHLKGNLMLGLESSFNRMTNLASQEIYFGRQEGLDEILAAIEKVDARDVRATAAEIFAGRSLSAAVLGKLPEGFALDRKALRL